MAASIIQAISVLLSQVGKLLELGKRSDALSPEELQDQIDQIMGNHRSDVEDLERVLQEGDS